MWSKYRIPTIIGILILIAGIGAGIYVVSRSQTALFPRAAPEFTPKQVRITNISENSFTVSWVTDEATSGFVKLGTEANKLNQTFGDDRDQKSGTVGNSLIHLVTVRGLKPQTGYWFKLGSGPSKTMYDNQGQAYQVTTAAVLGTPPPADTAYGTVTTAAGSPVKGAIVYVQLPGATPLAALVQDNGNWAVALSTARTTDLGNYASYDAQATTMELLVQAGKTGTATVTVNTDNDSPVPTITLGKTHDFRTKLQEKTPQSEATGSAMSQFSVTPLGDATEEASGAATKVTLLNPAQENVVLTATQPAFLGKGPAGVKLTITVNSPQPYTGTVTVKPDGSWDWTPPAGLTPGTHTITVTFTDDAGKQQTVTRNFVIAAAGSSLPSFTASPSATATPTASPKASPSARVSLPSTASGVPTSGTLTPTLVLFILGTTLMSLGVVGQLKKGWIHG